MENTILDMLTKDSVSFKKQSDTGIWRRAYINSTQGRAQVDAEVEEPYKSVILETWGDTPTIPDVTD